MDRVPDGITPMLKDLEHHIINQGLADMIASADIITQVHFLSIELSFFLTSFLYCRKQLNFMK